VTTRSDLYRGEQLVRYPAGDKHALLVVGRAQAPFALPERVAGALQATLRQFRTLEAHMRALGELLGESPDAALARQCVARWAESGVLLRSGAVLDAARAVAGRAAAAGSEALTPVRTVGVLTCDRASSLRACVESFADNARRHGDACRVVVVDDSTSEAARAANLAALASIAATASVPMAYAGAGEKRAYADRLARRTGVDPEIVSFALFGLPECGCTIGANRNALLLACAGEAFLSTDDDTVARLGRWPDGTSSGGIDFATDGDAMEFRFFPSREAALASVPAADESVLRAHGAALGRSLAAIVTDELAGTARSKSADPNENAGVDLDGATAVTLEGLASGSGRVAATIAGVYGDSGMFSGAGFVLHWVRDGRARYGEADYRLAVSSRELLRMAPRLRIRKAPPFLSTSVGLDHRTLLPPFLPVLRDEDGVFGETLSSCFEDAHVAHLPRAVLHAAPPGRRYDPTPVGSAAVRRLADLVVSYTHGLSVGFAVRDPAGRLAALGRAFEDLGRASAGDFLSVTRALLLFSAGARARHIDAMLQSAPGAPASWQKDARAYLEAQRTAATTEEHYLPADLRVGRSAQETLALAQRVLHLYGRLLPSWAALVEGARALREEGACLARPIEPG
jgi:hypothetical protein